VEDEIFKKRREKELEFRQRDRMKKQRLVSSRTEYRSRGGVVVQEHCSLPAAQFWTDRYSKNEIAMHALQFSGNNMLPVTDSHDLSMGTEPRHSNSNTMAVQSKAEPFYPLLYLLPIV